MLQNCAFFPTVNHILIQNTEILKLKHNWHYSVVEGFEEDRPIPSRTIFNESSYLRGPRILE